MPLVRSETDNDIGAIREVNRWAFPTTAEADLVDLLRDHGKLIISLVAEEDAVLLGHIAFSEISFEDRPSILGAGLGPMAVIPAVQRKGIGSQLVLAGLESCQKLGYGFVVVLGHPHYYPRFGFKPANKFGITCQWSVPDDAFMVLELKPASLEGIAGIVNYQPEFNEV